MEEYISELIEIGIGGVIDLSVDKYIIKDEIYTTNMEKAGLVMDKLRQGMSDESQEILDEYMDYILTANERACALAYLIGAKNTIKFMK